MRSRDEIIAVLRGALPSLQVRFSVAGLSIFGSLARGEAGRASDIDVLVEFVPNAPVTLLTLAGLQIALEELLGEKVDLVENHSRLEPAFREHIERDLIRVA
jgi:predicted nucleotidyltransferase